MFFQPLFGNERVCIGRRSRENKRILWFIFTPLHLIAINGSRESLSVAKVLLQNGANPNVVSKFKTTPLLMWQHGEQISDLLIDYGAKLIVPANK